MKNSDNKDKKKSIKIEKDLTEILTDINQKLDCLQKDVTEIKIELTTAKADREVLKGEINALKEDIKEINNSQNNKIWALIWILIWTLIGILITVVTSFLVAGGIFVISGRLEFSDCFYNIIGMTIIHYQLSIIIIG